MSINFFWLPKNNTGFNRICIADLTEGRYLMLHKENPMIEPLLIDKDHIYMSGATPIVFEKNSVQGGPKKPSVD